MAEITFINVGQGDSLVLEWLDEKAEKKIAIIDAKKVGKKSPVVNYIQSGNYTQIEFILLSHPHEDHYSGMLDLLVYIEENNIKVGWFGHTIDKSLTRDYWRLFEQSRAATSLFEKILDKAISLKGSLIKTFELPVKNWSVSLSPKVTIKAFSPSHDEIELFQYTVKYDASSSKKKASQAANLLSTILCITGDEDNILITSDAEVFSLERLQSQNLLDGINYKVVQVPHHGSKKNYSAVFWNNVISQKTAVISAGYNLKYKHPDLEVLKNLDSLNYTIHSTTISHGMKDFVKLKRRALLMDLVSHFDESVLVGGNKSFSI